MTEYAYVATVGKTPEKVLIGLRSRLNIKKVCLIGSDDEEVRQCMQDIKTFSEKLGYVVETVEANAFDILDVANRVNEIIQRHNSYAVIVNVSSGTRVMTIGALMAAFTNNSEAIYVPQQVSEKTPICIEIPSLDRLLEKIALPKKVLVREEDVLPELIKRLKEDHPTVHVETLRQVIQKMLQSGFEFNAWDTRFERYPNLVHIHEKTEKKVIREDAGPYQLVMHFDARCTRCESWFTFPIKIGLGYIPVALIFGEGEIPPTPEPAPPPFNSREYVDSLLKSRQDFYCLKCTLLLGLNNIIERLKKTQMIV